MAGSSKRKGKKINHRSSSRTHNQQERLNIMLNRDTTDDCGLEKALFKKVELQYAKTFNKLVGLKYPKEVALNAIKTNGSIYGPSLSIFDNIVRNSISYIETGNGINKNLCSKEGEPIMNLKDLVTYSMQALINSVGQDHPESSDVIKCILSDERFFKEEFLPGECSKRKEVEVEMNSPQVAGGQDKNLNDVTDEDLKKETQQVDERVMKAGEKLSHNVLEFHMLREQNIQTEGFEFTDKVDELKRIDGEIGRMKKETMELNSSNVGDKTSIAAYQSKFGMVEKKEKKTLEILSDTKNEVCELKRQAEEEKKEIAKIEGNVLKAAEAAKQAKVMKQMQEAEAKKQAQLVFLEEERLNIKAKEELELQVVTVRQELEASKQGLLNEIESRKNLLSRLQQQQQRRYVASPNTNRDLKMDVKKRSIEHICINCHTNNADVVFLPCKHEIICQNCNDNNAFGSSLKDGCPFCKFGIEETVNIY